MKNIYQIMIMDRNYIKYKIYLYPSLILVDLKITPLQYKLLDKDIFSYDDDTKMVEIIESQIRMMEYIPCILILKGNKTYGKYKNGKYLYQCIPNIINIPIFIVSYENKISSFSKYFYNSYICIKYVEWNNTYPIGCIKINLGEVNKLENFYEYQLYCKNLNISMNYLNKNINKQLKNNNIIDTIYNKYENISDRMNWSIFTIDNDDTLDYDDAISITFNNKNNTYMLSIYISNITLLIDTLGIWDILTNKVSSIYLPDKVIPMIPKILSNGLCSLVSGEKRIAFVMDIIIDKDYKIIDIQWENSIIKVYKNYRYEEKLLMDDKNYIMFQYIIKKLNYNYNYGIQVNDSHDIIAYSMIMMNYYSSIKLLEYKNGIFRSVFKNKDMVIEDNIDIPKEIVNFIKIYQCNNTSNYIDISKNENYIKHDILGLDSYIHITSPIRRLPDILNMIKMHQNLKLVQYMGNVDMFYEKWINNIKYINETMKNIKKIQTECYLLNYHYNNKNIIDRVYDGYIINKEEEINEISIIYTYTIYLIELKMILYMKINNINIKKYEVRKYKLYLFNDEEKYIKKIRLGLVN